LPKGKQRQRAGIGHNGEPPTHEDILKALAIEMAAREQVKKATELRKRARKGIEGTGVQLAMLDMLYKRKDDSPEEIEAFFRGLYNTFGAVHSEITQYDLFTVKADGATKAAYHMNGQMVAMAGEACNPPDGLVGEPLQEWVNGWHSGEAIRGEASKTLADTLASALAEADAGRVVDGTGKGQTLSDHDAGGLSVVERKTGRSKKSAKEKKAAVRLVAGTDIPPEDDDLPRDDDFQDDHPLEAAEELTI
jgi:hypothetical protein